MTGKRKSSRRGPAAPEVLEFERLFRRRLWGEVDWSKLGELLRRLSEDARANDRRRKSVARDQLNYLHRALCNLPSPGSRRGRPERSPAQKIHDLFAKPLPEFDEHDAEMVLQAYVAARVGPHEPPMGADRAVMALAEWDEAEGKGLELSGNPVAVLAMMLEKEGRDLDEAPALWNKYGPKVKPYADLYSRTLRFPRALKHDLGLTTRQLKQRRRSGRKRSANSTFVARS